MSDNSKSNDINQKDNDISVCDVLKIDTSRIIKKLESQTPAIFQNYSNLYTQYLHMWDDLFGTCYISEKEFFDKLNIDPVILKQIKENSEVYTNNFLEFIDMNARFMEDYFKMRNSAIKSYDNFMHTVMESYAKTLSQFNKSNKK
ncbi:hypothetical protein C5F47_07285 [Nitrosopumilus cobalaminigenes]|uniref:Uncharacterized protein n=1 Tax=Nitrosopumilus cobalaminigenes TaxID=1470066 RepID=A0A7D5R797_9ARCH|nr:hypothetical protein [Nitrosopumilus cobalaminigenes]QLH03362.1 hypothetical protein C5F47_07285 [Nitrosopumilus cobalaminigenes]